MNKYLNTILLCLILGLVGSCSGTPTNQEHIEDTPENRARLAEKYFELVPVEKFINDAGEEIALRMPPGSKKQFLEYWEAMNTPDYISRIETAAIQSFTKHLTAREIAVFIKFMEDPAGKSAMGKMKYYMADIMPLVQTQVQAVLEKAKENTANEGQGKN